MLLEKLGKIGVLHVTSVPVSPGSGLNEKPRLTVIKHVLAHPSGTVLIYVTFTPSL